MKASIDSPCGLALRNPQSRARRVLRNPRGGGGLARRSFSEGAFTLVEMLAVMAVIGIMFAVAVIGFSRFGRGARLRSAGRLIGQQLDLARQQALTQRTMYGVEFDKVDSSQWYRSYRIFYEDPNKPGPDKTVTVGKWIELPPGVEFGSVSGAAADDPPDEIEFKPTGSTVQPSVEFKIHDTETGKERLIKVVQITGHTEVTVPE